MIKHPQPALITETIWINENQAALINFDLLDGIGQSLERYVKAIEAALPQLCVEDGVLKLEDIWLETSIPRDLVREILQNVPLVWPANVAHIALDGKVVLERPTPLSEEGQG